MTCQRPLNPIQIDMTPPSNIPINHCAKYEHISSTLIFGNKGNNPFITIAIPTYRRTSTLRATLESAMQQKGRTDYEIIVVDNNPERNDETEKLMTRYKTVSNLRYYKNAMNLGMTGNWNRLYELAQGQWITMLHDDDTLSPYFVNIMSGIINNAGSNALIFPTYTSDEKHHWERSHEVNLQNINIWHFIKQNPIGPPIGMTIHRDKIFELGGFDEDYYPSADNNFYLRALLHGMSLTRIISSPTAFYRWGINESLNPETLKGFSRQRKRHWETIIQHISLPCRMLLTPYRRICDKIFEYHNSILLHGKQSRYPLSSTEKILYKIYQSFFYRFLLKYDKLHRIHIPE